MTGNGTRTDTMIGGTYAAFEDIYVRLGTHGWGQHEVDLWETPTVARFLGDDNFDPVIRGQRGPILLDRDRPDDSAPRPVRKRRVGRANPDRMPRRDTDPGRVMYGDAAR